MRDVTDCDRDLAFADIEKAAESCGVDIAGKSRPEAAYRPLGMPTGRYRVGRA